MPICDIDHYLGVQLLCLMLVSMVKIIVSAQTFTILACSGWPQSSSPSQGMGTVLHQTLGWCLPVADRPCLDLLDHFGSSVSPHIKESSKCGQTKLCPHLPRNEPKLVRTETGRLLSSVPSAHQTLPRLWAETSLLPPLLSCCSSAL